MCYIRGNPVGKADAIVPDPFLYNLRSHYLWYLGGVGKENAHPWNDTKGG